MKFYLVLMRCPRHGYQSISVDSGPATSGLRLTPDKCCGHWREVRRWVVDPDQVAGELRRYQAGALGARAGDAA